ncbi:PorV/PorQ family protein [bacterium]
MKKIILTVGTLLIISNLAFADSSGTTMADFLKLGINARPVAIGEAYTAISDDNHAMHYNPAGLAKLEQREVSFSHLSYVALINYDNVQYAHPLENSVLGAEIKFLHAKDERRDEEGNKLGSFYDYNSAITIAYAKSATESLDYGLSLKVLQMRLDDEAGTTAAIDAGLLYFLSSKIKLGVVMQNLGFKMKIADDKANLPAVVKCGISYKFIEQAMIATDINIPFEGEKSFSIGSEYSPVKLLAIRAGYKFREQGNLLGGVDGLTTGVGFMIKGYSLDYTFVPFGEFTETHRVSLKVKF